jgi:hypothetical protein
MASDELRHDYVHCVECSTSNNYRWNWFECVSTDCRTTMFDIEKPAGTGTEPAESVDGGSE